MIYAVFMAAGIMEFIFAVILALRFFDFEVEIEAAYQDGYEYGLQIGKYLGAGVIATAPLKGDDEYYDALVDEANCWFGMDGDA